MRTLARRTCPRCNTRTTRGTEALSRTDNRTKICSACGTDEAMQDWLGTGPTPQDQWHSRKA